jgi:excisionase family DNA binding protein
MRLIRSLSGIAMNSAMIEFLSKADAARALGLSVRSVDRAIRSGELRSIRIGRRRLVPRAELARLAASAEFAGILSQERAPLSILAPAT